MARLEELEKLRLQQEVVALLTERSLILCEGTIVDATLIAAPPSTKNRDRKQDAEMGQFSLFALVNLCRARWMILAT